MINLKIVKTIAVVGASNDPEKYGYKIVKNLKSRGFTVWPVNTKEKEILDLPVFSKLENLPSKPNLVVLVVPASVGVKIVEQIVTLGMDNVWVQPGAESSELLGQLDRLKLNYVSQACIMIN